MSCGIYKIEHNENIIYVGSSINIEKRWKQHISRLKKGKHHNFLLQRVYDKYGINVFKFSVLEECDVNCLISREQYFIDSLNPLFNLSDSSGRHLHTEETKAKMRGRIVSEETRKKLSETHKGKNGRKGIKTGRVPRSAFKKGFIPWNKNTKGLMVAWNKGKPWSEESKRKMSESHKNKQPTQAQIIYWESLKGKNRNMEVANG